MSANSGSMFAVRDAPGNGLTLVATQNIPKGTRIIREEPAILIPRSLIHTANPVLLEATLMNQFRQLSENQQKIVLAMPNPNPVDPTGYAGLGWTLGSVFRRNGVYMGEGGVHVYLHSSILQHACANNAAMGLNKSLRTRDVHAIRDIAEGEEITVAHVCASLAAEQRAEALRKRFGPTYNCRCRLCSLGPAEQKMREARLREVRRLSNLIAMDQAIVIRGFPLRQLRYMDQLFRLQEQLNPGAVAGPRGIGEAMEICVVHGDMARARAFAKWTLESQIMTCGEDSEAAARLRELCEDPTVHRLYDGVSKIWATTVTDIPQGLPDDEFQDWLWRREKPQNMGVKADFRNRFTFPTYKGIPIEDDCPLTFYRTLNGFAYGPKRHWCLFGEIVDFSFYGNLGMSVKDADGTVFPVDFQTVQRGHELNRSLLRRGNAIAILYAEQGVSPGHGIQLRSDNFRAKIFNLPLADLLQLSDRVQKYSTARDATRTCHGCDNEGSDLDLKKCARCGMFSYCGTACQTIGWKDKNHKADCKHLSDSDLRGLFSFDWGMFHDYVEFPLNSMISKASVNVRCLAKKRMDNP